jgi:3-oxoacyl-[acyl-carrier-protein] synthase II
LFDTGMTRAKLGAEVPSFQPDSILGPKGLRLLDRITKLGLCAAKLALDDSGLAITEDTADAVGIVLGTTYGSMSSRMDYYLEAIQQGPRSVNPALFPNTIANSPASQIAIRFGIRGFNTTLSTGFTSAIEAALQGARFIAENRAKAVLVGGVEELSPLTLLAFERTGMLSSQSERRQEICAPYDARRNGAVLGEGAALLLLEDMESARSRGARIYAEFLGGAAVTDPKAFYRYRIRGGYGARCIRDALAQSLTTPGEIDYVAAGANSHPVGDAAEARSLWEALDGGQRPIIASASKSMLGETFSASGGLQMAAALLSLEQGVIPPTIHHEQPDSHCPLDCVPNQSREARIDRVLVFSQSPLCQSAACVLGRNP